MSLPVVVGIALLGGTGAVARLLLDGAVAESASGFPYGTLAVNLLGSLLLGLLVGLTVSTTLYRLLGTGLLGAFTTFSTWALESHRLGEDGQLRLAALNFVLSLVLGVLAAWVGRHLGVWL
ncbi:MAG TPA: fluoride efflux transporter CrcB [Solirubrobacteraceae bacterium]|jgi:CrcB protein|nr:fluoride efflux transporter CrcB [Solirubrobacteraceae bacterium]